ncbi:hypothetical protein MNBD_GAMMA09-3070 [hydrothermal vent metagenome]|uniref:Intracellular sulfur oxidation DsrE/DsrF family protein n=1 Tax=hydrothermal vent metagenome TaxID=652676 RepID=A0A3B0XHS0_9ZZZZ
MNFSDEMINAYADGELQGGEKLEFEHELQNDPQLQHTIADLKALKLQLSHAYKNIDAPERAQLKATNYRMLAYAAFLIVAFGSGWISSDFMHTPRVPAEQAGLFAQGVQAVSAKPGKYILHIGLRDDGKFRKTLDEAESLLKKYKNNQQDIELEIIANAGGLDLFRVGATPYSDRVRQLGIRYPNIKFIACSNAIQRLKEKGIEPTLLAAVYQGPVTAIDQVVKRVNEGWTYIKI